MQRDQILAMDPGRELDELIHKYVLKADYPFELAYQRGETRWSQDIAFAWEVVEKIHADGEYNLALEWYPQEKEWGADFDEWGVTSQCCAKTAPLAICRAALLAVIEEVPNET